MNIHKIGHCCLVLDIDGKKILTDPGSFTSEQVDLRDIDVVVITHKHEDHLDPNTIKTVAENNLDAVFVANEDIGSVLSENSIIYETISAGETKEIKGITFEAFANAHAHIYEGVPLPDNTGYLIADRFYLPGDSLVVPGKEIEILAAPFAAPWGKIGEYIDYIKEVKPKHAFPIHDGMQKIYGAYHALPEKLLPEAVISFTALKPGENLEI